MLQMREHGAPEIEYNPFAGQSDNAVLHVVGPIIDRDHGREYGDRQGQEGRVRILRNDRLVDRETDNQRYGELRAGKYENRGQGAIDALPIRIDIGHESTDDPIIEASQERVLAQAFGSLRAISEDKTGDIEVVAFLLDASPIGYDVGRMTQKGDERVMGQELENLDPGKGVERRLDSTV